MPKFCWMKKGSMNPVGERDEVTLQLAQYLGGEDEQQNNDLQCGGQLDAEILLDEEGQHEPSRGT